ncbi:RusA family crossover junction endodeoxyribonuclease [Peptococcus simiae]|uniref:RusA family crossover junction endodeoxyribonuclease n=1 Tax=Peptococcus simiae TaxID=1643805 RepID=A0ABW9H0L9_9FIRM
MKVVREVCEKVCRGCLQFFLPMHPPRTTHQQKEIRCLKNKPIVYESPKLKAARSKLMAHLGKYVPAEKWNGPIRLQVKWLFSGKGHDDGEWKITRPDTDNLQKLLKDCMTDLGFWEDDALVVSEIVEKFWSKQPGIFIRVERLELVEGGFAL